jgi:hypothetical protein
MSKTHFRKSDFKMSEDENKIVSNPVALKHNRNGALGTKLRHCVFAEVRNIE